MAENLDDWSDDDFGNEFAKFKEASEIDSSLYDEDVSVIYIKPKYDSIKSYINQWNKNRKKILINEIRIANGTPFESDEIHKGSNVYLDMGARLFNAIKPYAKTGTDYLKIMKISNPKDKFDVQYYASEYTLITQKKIPTKSKKK